MNKQQQLSNAILTKISTLVWTNKPFVNAFDYFTLSNTGYPFICFECVWFEANILDTCNNKRDYIYRMLIVQDYQTDRQDAYQRISKAMSDVIDLFDADYTLWLSEVRTTPMTWSIEWIQTESGKAIVAEIALRCQTINYIN